MMMILKALLRQLFGTGHGRLIKSLSACLILYLAVIVAEIRLPISPAILYLTAIGFTGGVLWQTIRSTGTTELLTGFYLLPSRNRQLTAACTLGFGFYTLITKTLPVLSLLLAAGVWTAPQIMTACLGACITCLVIPAIHSMPGIAEILCALLWAACTIPALFWIHHPPVLLTILTFQLALALIRLLMADRYTFYRIPHKRVRLRRLKKNGIVFLYLFRYLRFNKRYLANTAFLCAFAAFLPLLLGNLSGQNAMPMGYAVLCMNTPICILLSCDPDLKRGLSALPGQAPRFCSQYFLFIFLFHVTIDGIYVCSWLLLQGSIRISNLLAGILIASQAALLSVILEWKFPIRSWKLENDLWHHPRKYIVPLLMLLLSVLVGTWPAALWLWLILPCLEGIIIIKQRRLWL